MYKVLAAMRQDLNEGWVWLSSAGFEPRSIIKIKNKKNGEVVFCECLEIDDNFLYEYNNPPREHINKDENTIVINSWYRKRLGGIETKTNQELEIRAANKWWGKLRFNWGHPQVVVRMATWLALLSLGLGILGVLLSLK